ncbi:MAG: VOC family protein, partial [Pseudomonadota bacterium]|nr:VOC family protein [Pseudomonadota bacterium]
MTERPSAFRGIRHVAFRVTNLEECEEFYKEVMGMELLYRANENLVYLTCGNDNLSLARVDEASSRGSTFDHYGFIVEDKETLDAWHAYFSSRGDVPVMDEPHDHA